MAVAVAVCVWYVAQPVPRVYVEAVGAPQDGVARYGGLRMVWVPPAGFDLAAVSRRFEQRGIIGTLHPRDNVILVELPGISEADMPRMRRLLAGEGRVELFELGESGVGEVLLEAGELDEVAITSHLVPGQVVAISFGAATASRIIRFSDRLEGHRLAVVVAGKVRSTPVFHGVPRFSFAWFAVEHDELDELATTLRAGALPGGTIVGSAYVPPTDITRLIWIARIAIAAGAGGAIGLIAGLFAAVLRSEALRVTTAPQPARTRRLGPRSTSRSCRRRGS